MTISRLERGEAVSVDTTLRALSECGYAIAVSHGWRSSMPSRPLNVWDAVAFEHSMIGDCEHIRCYAATCFARSSH